MRKLAVHFAQLSLSLRRSTMPAELLITTYIFNLPLPPKIGWMNLNVCYHIYEPCEWLFKLIIF